MDQMTIAWIVSTLAALLLAARDVRDFLWARTHKVVLCQYEWCTFGATAHRDQSELAYVAMNQHLKHEHGTGPWANGVLGSSH